MKTKQINGKTAGNSLENGRKLSAVENVFHAVKTAARTVFAASALGVLLAGTAFAAAGEDVYDMADLFTDEEEKQLSEQAQVLSDTMKMEAVIVTIEENSDSAQVFADGFYMGIDGAAVPEVAVAPDILEELVAPQDGTGIFCKL